MQFKQINLTRLVQTADDLLGLIVTFFDKDGLYSDDGLIGFVKCQVFKRFRLFKNKNNEWCVNIDCHDDVLKMMFELKGYFFKYQLWNALQLTGKNQQRMYEILKQYEHAGVREISLKDLREFIGIQPDEYARWERFKTRILEPAQEALANYTDIKFTWEIVKRGGRGGKIEYLKFNIEKNKDYINRLTLDEYLTNQEEPQISGELSEFEYENENLRFLAEACDNVFDNGQMQKLFFLLNKIISSSTKEKTMMERYEYLAEKYTYSKNRSTEGGKLFNYLKKVIEADITG